MNIEKSGHSDTEIRLQAILDTAVDAIICINSHGIIDLYNYAAEKIFGYSAAEVIGRNVSILMPEPYASEHDEYIARYEKTGEKKIIGIGRETIARHKDGRIFPIDLAVSETVLGGRRLYTGIVRDITQRKQTEEEIKHYKKHLEKLVNEKTRELEAANEKLKALVNIDSLTDLENRRYFDEVLNIEIRRAARTDSPLSLLMCDIDYFKLYNDHYGHVKGDECLKKIARCFKNTFMRATDVPARFGGEEFSVILPDTELEEAMQLSEKLSESIHALNIIHAASSAADHITLSTGIACMQAGMQVTCTELIRMADAALYAAKANGRNRIEVYGDLAGTESNNKI